MGVLVSVEVGAAFNDPGVAELAILSNWRNAAGLCGCRQRCSRRWPVAEAGERGSAPRCRVGRAAPLPLVLFLDEIDALQNATLISVLRQLRAGVSTAAACVSLVLALIGLRDVRDYKVAAGGSERLNTASPFNIKTESFTLRHFTAGGSGRTLPAAYRRHRAGLSPRRRIAYAFELTQGQPWLVNALARQAVEVIVPDPTSPWHRRGHRRGQGASDPAPGHAPGQPGRAAARAARAPRHRADAGRPSRLSDVPEDDIRFVVDLGLVPLRPRRRAGDRQPDLPRGDPPRARLHDCSLAAAHPPHLAAARRPPGRRTSCLDAFLAFWRQHGQPLLGSAPYHEIAPHLVLMAFLHRVVNGGGTLEREYAIGTRADGPVPALRRATAVTLGIELKVWREGEDDPLEEGLAQLGRLPGGSGPGDGLAGASSTGAAVSRPSPDAPRRRRR